MSLLDGGMYTIISKATKNRIGRFYLEDMSFKPKRIVDLGSQVMSPSSQPWEIEVHDGGYKIKALGAPVGEIDGLLWAHLAKGSSANDWSITPCPHQGENVYIIHKQGSSMGWIASTKEQSQVAVRPLTCTTSCPPWHFTDDELFVIVPAYEYGSLGI
ncbi:hypothetical protein PHLGIDRAFT_16588 [Phlebiopsis gigantea 11061_1 CR5-6]|uniref:Ricin B lectin domain-containing protein n=1 Tax=Phlebiopsis gigantea (strain 11061_1 CR5-6) TaxID=745531 RepID=A0A0C3S0B3_PHLG1|nr:hypothetical protein PHLGIDRAFT_16588 [Phlebiopsis gigantea 11061_1 CR5-6]